MKYRILGSVIFAVMVLPVQAQQPKGWNESFGASDYLAAMQKAAGTQWSAAVDFLCAEEPDVGTPAESPVIEPTQLFDNLYVIGRSGTVVYALTTSEGIILIDAGYEGQEESVLLPGLESLGLSPDDIEYVIIAHGHRDHFGGARYLQQNYGARIILSAADWNLVEEAAAGDDALPPPTRDMVATEGELITLGDTKVTPVLVPGHTPGSLGVIFQVRDGDASHTAALFGGTILIAARIADDGLRQYFSSVEHFAEVASDMGVDVEIQNHPIFDNMSAKLAALKKRNPGASHPFVVGEENYQKFLDVIAGCTLAEILRRSESP